MKFMYNFIILILFINLSGLSSASEFSNENLIQPFPVPGGPWRNFEKKDEDGVQVMWKNKGGDEILHTLIIYDNEHSTVNGIINADENEMNKACENFSSKQ